MPRGPSPDKTEATRARLLAAAASVIADRGYSAFTMKELAERAGTAVGLVYRYFPSREALVLGIYAELARRTYARATSLGTGTVGARFAELLGGKLDELERQPMVFRALAHAALAPDASTAVLADETRSTREEGIAAFTTAVRDATNAPADPEPLGRILYGMHLLFVLAWTQRASKKKDDPLRAVVTELAPLLDLAVLASGTPIFAHALRRLDALARSLLENPR